jgi:Tol biopolymer transport system component
MVKVSTFSRLALASLLALLLSVSVVQAQWPELPPEPPAFDGQASFLNSLCFVYTVTTFQGNAAARNPVVSADGRYIAFESDASDLVDENSIGGADTNGATDIFVYDRLTCTIERVSLNSNEEQTRNDTVETNGPDIPCEINNCFQAWSRRPSISADGRYVAFISNATNLVPDDVNTWRDVFVRDRVAGTTERINNVAPEYANLPFPDNQILAPSDGATISANGRFVAFYSGSGRVVSGDTNSRWDVFVTDRNTGTTIRVSTASNGTQGNHHSGVNASINNFSSFPAPDHIGVSNDGRYIAFVSWASNLVPGDTNNYCENDGLPPATDNCSDIFVKDIVTGTTTRVSISNTGQEANSASTYPDISANGQIVTFQSTASNLVPNDTNNFCNNSQTDPDNLNCSDIFVRDIAAGTTTRVSVSTTGVQGGLASYQPTISADGRYVAFVSDSTLLFASDDNQLQDILVHDRVTKITKLVSSAFNGVQSNGGSFVPEISDNGMFVAFESDARNIVTGDLNNGVRDIFSTNWPYISAEPNFNIALNGSFTDPIGSPRANWVAYGTPTQSAVQWRITQVPGTPVNNILEFYRVSGTETALVYQNTTQYLWQNSPIEVTFQAGNTSAIRKRLTVLVHDADFTDLQVCTFWIPPNTPLQTTPYRIVTRNGRSWMNASISIYASTADSMGWLQLDNVTMAYNPSLVVNQHTCQDPRAPGAGAGADSGNLVNNGDFSAPLGGTNGWRPFGTPTLSAIVAQISNGVLEFYRHSGTTSAVVIQETGNTSIPANTWLEASFQLGNSSALRKRVTVLLHKSDFTDLNVCTFWLNPGAPLQTYTMRTYTTAPWNTGAAISIYASTADSSGWYRVDNVVVRHRPSQAQSGTTCSLAGAVTAADAVAEEMRPTLEPTATPEGGELPIIATPTPVTEEAPEGQLGEEIPLIEPTAFIPPTLELTVEPPTVEPPTLEPTAEPTDEPTVAPVEPSPEPPTLEPTAEPTVAPVEPELPTTEPTPMEEPTAAPVEPGGEGIG